MDLWLPRRGWGHEVRSCLIGMTGLTNHVCDHTYIYVNLFIPRTASALARYPPLRVPLPAARSPLPAASLPLRPPAHAVRGTTGHDRRRGARRPAPRGTTAVRGTTGHDRRPAPRGAPPPSSCVPPCLHLPAPNLCHACPLPMTAGPRHAYDASVRGHLPNDRKDAMTAAAQRLQHDAREVPAAARAAYQ